MPARKNRENKYGTGTINTESERQLMSLIWYGNTGRVAVDTVGDTVLGENFMLTGSGHVVRGLCQKGFLSRERCAHVPRPDGTTAAVQHYRITDKGRRAAWT